VTSRNETQKLQRRLYLLDDLLDYAMRSGCKFAMCDGPLAPIKPMRTCTRCACIHRAIQMGLVRKANKTHVRNELVISAGTLEQFSAVNGSRC